MDLDFDWWLLCVGYGVMAGIVYSFVYWVEVVLGLPQQENARNLDDSFTDLKNMVERIIEQVFKIPEMLDYSGVSPPATPTQPAFNPKKYEDLLATAVLNKIVEKFEKEQFILRQRRGSSGQSYNDWSSKRKRNLNTISNSDSSDEPRSESSHLHQIRARQMALNLKEQGLDDSGLPLDTTPGSPTSDEEYLSDYIQNHRVPLPQLNPDDVTVNGLSADDAFPSIVSNGTGDSDWQENWMFKKRAQSSESDIPTAITNSVGMLVPSPTEEVKTLIGDRTADEVSDLSEAGSDVESEMTDDEENPANDLPHALLNGANNEHDLLQLDSLVSLQSQSNETNPKLLDAKNELILVTDISQIEVSDPEFDHHALDAIVDGTYGSSESPKIVGVTPSVISQNATLLEDKSDVAPVPPPPPSHYSPPVPPFDTHHSPLSPKLSQFTTDQHELIVELGGPSPGTATAIELDLEDTHPVIVVDSPLPELPSLHTHPLLGHASLADHFQRSLGLTDNLRRALAVSSPSPSADVSPDKLLFHTHPSDNPINLSNHHHAPSTSELAAGEVTTEPPVLSTQASDQQHHQQEYICKVAPTEYDLTLDDADHSREHASESLAALEVVDQLVAGDDNTVPKGIAICSKPALVAMELASADVDVHVGIIDTSSGFVSSASEANSVISCADELVESVRILDPIGSVPTPKELSNAELIASSEEIKQPIVNDQTILESGSLSVDPTLANIDTPEQRTEGSVQEISVSESLAAEVPATQELSNLELIVSYEEIQKQIEESQIEIQPEINTVVTGPQELSNLELIVSVDEAKHESVEIPKLELGNTGVTAAQELSNLELIVSYDEIKNQIEESQNEFPEENQTVQESEITSVDPTVQAIVNVDHNVSESLAAEVPATQELSNLELIVSYEDIKKQIEESQDSVEVSESITQPEINTDVTGTQELSNLVLIVSEQHNEERQHENTIEVTNSSEPIGIEPKIGNTGVAGTQELSNLELIVSYDEIQNTIEESQNERQEVTNELKPIDNKLESNNTEVAATKELSNAEIKTPIQECPTDSDTSGAIVQENSNLELNDTSNAKDVDVVEAINETNAPREGSSVPIASPELFILNVKAEADVEWLAPEQLPTAAEESVSIPTLLVSAAVETLVTPKIALKQTIYQDSLEIPEIDARENYDEIMKPIVTQELANSDRQDEPETEQDSDISDFVVVSEQEQHALQLEETASNEPRDSSILLPLLTTLSTDIRTSNPSIPSTTNTPNVVDATTGETVDDDDDDDELSVVLRPRNENGDILGSIAEREHNKWKHAEDMPNNPYTPEALQHRLSNSSLSRTIDVERLATQVQSTDVESPSDGEHVGLIEKPDITRYGRDYYINESKTAAGKRSSYDDWSSSTPSTPVDQHTNNTAAAAATADTDIYTARPVLVRPTSVEDLSPAPIDSSLTPSEDSDTTRVYDLTNRETSILRNAIIRTSRLPAKEPTPRTTVSPSADKAPVSRATSFSGSERSSFEQLDNFRRAIEQPQDAPIILSTTTLHAKPSTRLQQFSVVPKAKLFATFPRAKTMEETQQEQEQQQQPAPQQTEETVAVSHENSIEVDVVEDVGEPVVPVALPRAVPQETLYIPPRFEHEELVSYNEPIIVSKTVIEEDVLPALPSVRALAKSFVDLHTTVDETPINRPKSLNWQTPNTFDTSKDVTPSDTFPFYNQGYHPVAPGHSITARNLSTQFRDELRISGSAPNLSAAAAGRTSPERPPSPTLVPGILKNNVAFFENLNNKH